MAHVELHILNQLFIKPMRSGCQKGIGLVNNPWKKWLRGPKWTEKRTTLDWGWDSDAQEEGGWAWRTAAVNISARAPGSEPRPAARRATGTGRV